MPFLHGTIPAIRVGINRTGIRIKLAHIARPTERKSVIPGFGNNVPGIGFEFAAGGETKADLFVARLAEVRDGTKTNNL